MEEGLTHHILRLVQQISVIVIAARIAGEFCERYLRQPGVLGELVIGMIIGPYALGGMIDWPGLHGPLFPLSERSGSIPVSSDLYSFGQIAAVILLFVAGLETDLKQFLRYGLIASLIGLGGVLLPFFGGAYATVWFGAAESMSDPKALFMGAAMAATSVGITARVLSDIGRLDTPEGVTIIAGAVVDDVFGILLLSIVVSLVREGGEVSWGDIGITGLRAFGFWIGLTAVGLLLSRRIEKLLLWFRGRGSALVLALGICFAGAAAAEAFGLAMIIGAYAVGLALSERSIAKRLEGELRPIYHFMVPVFFVVMGMLVDFNAIRAVLLFGTVLSMLAILSKVLGCGLPAFGLGFNFRGAYRIGIGMMPRGEVALIVAGIGLASGAIQSALFGVTVMMTFVTTLLAPILLVPAFAGGLSGRRKPDRDHRQIPSETLNKEG